MGQKKRLNLKEFKNQYSHWRELNKIENKNNEKEASMWILKYIKVKNNFAVKYKYTSRLI